MERLIRFIYSFFVMPLMIGAAHLAIPFNARMRKAVLKRHTIIPAIRSWMTNRNIGRKCLMIHASSMGEFEHIKPLIRRLNERFNVDVIVTFFSPSAYDVVTSFEGVELFLYLPFDTPRNWRRIYRLLNPALVVISKHDVWPNQVWIANERHIPVYLVNASLSERSRRINPWARILLKTVYCHLEEIYTISSEDKERFLSFFGNIRIRHMGDTKFDQVLIRKERALEKSILNESWTSGWDILVLGSVWPEDTQHLLSSLSVKLKTADRLKIIIVPHQPTPKFIDHIIRSFRDIPFVRFTEPEKLRDQRILIVDKIGVLADLYRYGFLAYVGGSFRQGIHNVMEPAIYHIPVIYGPVYRNSFEAVQLHEAGGSRIVHNGQEFNDVLDAFLNDRELCISVGQQAGAYARKNVGATERILTEWQSLLDE